MKRIALFACTLALTAGCAGVPNSPQPESGLVPTAKAEASATHRASGVRLVFKVPRAHHRSRSNNPHYISPSTQSFIVAAQPRSGSPTSSFVNVTPGSADCSGALLQPLVCTLTMALEPGAYTLTISSYDAAQTNALHPQGNLLSTSRTLATIVTGAMNAISATLDAVPASIGLVAPTDQTNLIGNETIGLHLLAGTSSKLLAAAYDADGNLIVGPGSPVVTLRLQNASGGIAITSPAGAAANAFTLSSKSVGTATLVATATPGTGSPLSTQAAVTAVPTTSLVAGQIGNYGSQDGRGTNAMFGNPGGLAYDPDNGNVYVVDFFECNIRQVTPDGVVTTIAGRAAHCDSLGGDFNKPSSIAYDHDDGDLYVSDTLNCTIDRVALNGAISRIAGTAGTCNASPQNFYQQQGIVYAGNGTLYVADTYNASIKKIASIDTAPAVSTLIGNPGSCDAVGSDLCRPEGLTFDGSSLYFTDEGNCEIRKVTLTGTLTTVAGNPNQCIVLDGTGSAAEFYEATDLTYDSSEGAFYVADGCAMRLVTASGQVSTLFGNQGECSYQEGTLLTPAFADWVEGVAYVPSSTGPGTVYFSDAYDYVVRQMQL